MREHTVTKLREMLSQQDRSVVSELKEKQRHRSRSLSESRLSFVTGNPSRDKQTVRAAAVRAGFKNPADIRALADAITANPDSVFSPKMLGNFGMIARGAVSAALGGGFDTDYELPAQHGVLSHTASSLERIGGPVGTNIYKAGRKLQSAEKWFTTWDPDVGDSGLGVPQREYTRGSAFDPHGARGRRDQCVKRRISVPGEKPFFVGYEMGTPGYERCMNDRQRSDEIAQLQRVLKKPGAAAKLPDLARELGIEPEEYLKHRRADMEYRGRFWRRAVQGQRAR